MPASCVVSRAHTGVHTATTRRLLKAPPRRATSTSTPRCNNTAATPYALGVSTRMRPSERAGNAPERGQCVGVDVGETRRVLGGCRWQLSDVLSSTHCCMCRAVWSGFLVAARASAGGLRHMALHALERKEAAEHEQPGAQVGVLWGCQLEALENPGAGNASTKGQGLGWGISART